MPIDQAVAVVIETVAAVIAAVGDGAFAAVRSRAVGVAEARLAPCQQTGTGDASRNPVAWRAGYVAHPAVLWIILDVDALARARRETRRTNRAGNAAPQNARLAGVTGHATAAAVARIDVRVDAALAARRLCGRTRARALAAALLRGALRPAMTAVVVVVGHVDARAAAVGSPRRTRRPACARRADLPTAARRPAASAIVRIDLRIDTLVGAQLALGRAGAVAVETALFGRARQAAVPAMPLVTLQVEAAAVAGAFARRTRRLARARRADLPTAARRPAASAIVRIDLRIDTLVGAQLALGRAGAAAVETALFGRAHRLAVAAMLLVVSEVNANLVARGLTDRTSADLIWSVTAVD